jgi:micrococcal nuclease
MPLISSKATQGQRSIAGRIEKSHRAGLAALIALCTVTTACGSYGAETDAKGAAIVAAQEAARAVKAEAQVLGESFDAGVDAAMEKHADLVEGLSATRTAAAESIDEALEKAAQLFAGTREDLVSSIQGELSGLDARLGVLGDRAKATKDEANDKLGFLMAVLMSKKSIVETQLALLQEAPNDGWQVLADPLKEDLAQAEQAIADAEVEFDETIAEASAATMDWLPGKPAKLFEVVKVVDGDTIHIMRNGEKQKLRLLSVDTEEKLSGRAFNPSKPETLFGEETKLWAIDFFNGLANEDSLMQVGVIFPKGVEAYDVYGRLLCHVVLPDGTDFNLQLVEQGWSPYFTKYGYSRICHDAFQAAEVRARKAQLGIWNPEVNKPATASDPWNKRDYDAALPWWHARGDAIANYRLRSEGAPGTVASAESEEELLAAKIAGESTDYPKTVFGAVDRAFEESDGSLTLLFRAGGEDQKAFRAKISKGLRPKLAELNLKDRGEGGVQNYLFVSGKVVEGQRGYDIHVQHESAISLAAPDPVFEDKE